LHETGLKANYLELELTESMVMQNVEEAIETMRELKAMGVRLSIDDFGTGYSSLSCLKRFPIDVLKIDKSFVKDILTEDEDMPIVPIIITLAHGRKLQVIAEGVETDEQLAYLRKYHCDQLQGYLFSRPVPADECAKLLRGEILMHRLG
jgi:EAL domain-containing protein (putative c-di-GMP-specific phosphodiesterase class I)